MRKYIFQTALAAICAAMGLSASAQVPSNRLEPTENKLVEDAVKGGIVVMEQQFRVQDKATGKIYGLDTDSIFGKSFAVAFKVNNAYVVTSRTTKPWSYNDEFAKINKNYYPVPHYSFMRPLADESYKFVYLDTTAMTSVGKDVYKYESTDPVKGFVSKALNGTADGLMAWVKMPQNFEKDGLGTLTLDVVKQKISFGDAASASVKVPSLNNAYLGGIFVVPEIAETGTIRLCVAGILAKGTDGSWNLMKLNSSSKIVVEQPKAEPQNKAPMLREIPVETKSQKHKK
jgi:hypothetical protein